MTNNEEVKKLLMEAIDMVCILNELVKIENMCNVDYSEVYDDLIWNKLMLRNRLDSLNELKTEKKDWKTAKEYLDKVSE